MGKNNNDDDKWVMFKCNLMVQEFKEKLEKKYNSRFEIIVDWL